MFGFNPVHTSFCKQEPYYSRQSPSYDPFIPPGLPNTIAYFRPCDIIPTMNNAYGAIGSLMSFRSIIR